MHECPQMPLRRAAVVAGFAYLLNPVSYAEFVVYPKLVVSNDMARTAANIAADSGHFVGAIFCYFLSAVGDIVLAWALYHVMAPVSRSLARLASWFQLVYAAIFIVAALNLVGAYDLVVTPEYSILLSPLQFEGQLLMQLHAFRNDWAMGLILFGIHLVLLGILIIRSNYIPRFIGVLLILNGLGWMVDSIAPYVFPNLSLDYVQVTFVGELGLMFWLLIRGRKIGSGHGAQQPGPRQR